MTERADTGLHRQEGTQPEDSSPQDKIAASRRRFVKGAAMAAPAVMTLRGGQALAQSSFALSACKAEMTEMGLVAQQQNGQAMYFIVNERVDGSITVTPSSAENPQAQTVTPSCMMSLI